MNDGRTNGSLANGALIQPRDTIGDTVSRQRDSFVARIAPTLKVAEDLSVTLGISGQTFRTNFSTPALDNRVSRGDIEAALSWAHLTAFGEFCWQEGHHVLTYPLAGIPSNRNVYVMAGLMYALEMVTFRYDFSSVRYENQVREQFHMLAAVAAVHKHLSLWVEYVYWRQRQPGIDTTLDRSLNFVVDVHF